MLYNTIGNKEERQKHEHSIGVQAIVNYDAIRTELHLPGKLTTFLYGTVTQKIFAGMI